MPSRSARRREGAPSHRGSLAAVSVQTADIFLFETDEVRVAEAQVPHDELTRDLALRFNRRIASVFTVHSERTWKTRGPSSKPHRANAQVGQVESQCKDLYRPALSTRYRSLDDTVRRDELVWRPASSVALPDKPTVRLAIWIFSNRIGPPYIIVSRPPVPAGIGRIAIVSPIESFASEITGHYTRGPTPTCRLEARAPATRSASPIWAR